MCSPENVGVSFARRSSFVRWFVLHEIVRVASPDATESQPLIEPKRGIVLEPDAQTHRHPAFMCMRDDVAQHARAEAAILVAKVDLNLPNLDGIGLIENL